MADISLSDQYVLLLNDVVKENKALGEKIIQTSQSDQEALRDLSNKVESLAAKVSSISEQRRRIRQTGGGRVHVPKMCSNDVRRKIKVLAQSADEQFQLRVNESTESEHNLAVFICVKDELHLEYGGEEKSPWTFIQIKAAYKTYVKSKKAYAKRTENGTNQHHVTKCRRQNRKREKLGRRLSSLTAKDWGHARKAKVAEAMTLNCMSSEESEMEGGETNKYVVRPLSWESAELKKRKKSLDSHHTDSLPALVKQRVMPRRRGGELSTRPKPAECPTWACKTN